MLCYLKSLEFLGKDQKIVRSAAGAGVNNQDETQEYISHIKKVQ